MNQQLFALRNIADKAVKIVQSPATFRFYWQTYVLSKLDKAQVDHYFVSYPKCGRTWLRFMLQRYLALIEAPPSLFRDKSLLRLPDNRILKFEHDQGTWIPAPPKIEQLAFNATKYSGAKIIFMVRDPRDVLVSSWYHLKYRENIYPGSLSEFIRDDLVGINKIVAFMNLWLDHRHFPQKFLLLSYEQMHADPLTHFRHLLDFIEVSMQEEALQKAVTQSAFDKMKRAEGTEEREPWLKPGAKGVDKAMKVRKGKVGGFREELSTADVEFVNDVIRTQLSPQLASYQPRKTKSPALSS